MKLPYKLILFYFFIIQPHAHGWRGKKKQPLITHQLSNAGITHVTHEVYEDTAWLLISCESGFVLADTHSPKKCVLRNEKMVSIMMRNGAAWINGNRMPYQQMNIYPFHSGAHMMVNNKIVSGITMQRQKNQVLLTFYQNESTVQEVLALSTQLDVPIQGSKKIDQLQFLGQQQVTLDKPPRALNVRVLLDERDGAGQHSWEFLAPAGFLVHNNDSKKQRRAYSADKLLINYRKGTFYVNGKNMPGSQLFVRPKGAHIGFDGNTYQGGLWLVQHDKKVCLINCLQIEDYVFAVLRTESWPGWPLEINKVFAIASRTYVVSMVLNARKSKRLYHVKNTNEHQTYAGFHGCPVIRKAVEETKGVFLTHEQKPIVAMFDCCCGGIIPAHIEGVNFNDAPYLARTYACMHCRHCKIYSWQAEYTSDEFENLVKKHVHDFSKLKQIQIKRHDLAGVVQEAVIQGLAHKVALSGKEFYRLHKDIKSFAFSVTHTDDRIVFSGKGFGHHLGLCQWGAREMVREGWDYKKVLQFYYPGTDFMRLM